MTNAPFMLNVDCDMYANNPELVLHAMCLFLGSNDERDWGFVQCPQYFYDRPTDHLAVLHQVSHASFIFNLILDASINVVNCLFNA